MTYTFKPGDPCWVELYTGDTDRAVAFYGELFGWTADRAEEFGGYITFRKDGNAVAGGMRNDGADGSPDQWTVYLAAPDAQAVADAAAEHGGRVVLPPMPVGELGSMAVLADPSGAGVGVWQPGVHTGFGAFGMVSGGQWRDHVGYPSWFELHTPEYERALSFYREAFGWQDPFVISDAPEFRYTTIHSESPMLGGVMDAGGFLPAGSPGGWQIYFGVEDVDAAVKTVVALGGSVDEEPVDTPYGRMAAVVDPGGVRFRLGGNSI
ncbi:VOC family protein [Nocardia sp. CDC159]|uniref:VOC family protein n=1 Tax=Nocardia pulmonis TaxID=2951408 RepID=A0A9X2EC47_9NOCA|nr:MULTISPECIES: VOC family protein [Nocardia]MCM6777636.1 VOC family protein [Nocardia pulmonis]MCM6790560.1 VOC family protein [Nocardia sp. CDC159]